MDPQEAGRKLVGHVQEQNLPNTVMDQKKTSGQLHVYLAENHRSIECPPSDSFRIARDPRNPGKDGGGAQRFHCLRFVTAENAHQRPKKAERFVYRSVLLFWRGTSCRLLALRDVEFRSC
jgi:hypothetical protein